jgi:hypothetical protein
MYLNASRFCWYCERATDITPQGQTTNLTGSPAMASLLHPSRDDTTPPPAYSDSPASLSCSGRRCYGTSTAQSTADLERQRHACNMCGHRNTPLGVHNDTDNSNNEVNAGLCADITKALALVLIIVGMLMMIFVVFPYLLSTCQGIPGRC